MHERRLLIGKDRIFRAWPSRFEQARQDAEQPLDERGQRQHREGKKADSMQVTVQRGCVVVSLNTPMQTRVCRQTTPD